MAPAHPPHTSIRKGRGREPLTSSAPEEEGEGVCDLTDQRTLQPRRFDNRGVEAGGRTCQGGGGGVRERQSR